MTSRYDDEEAKYDASGQKVLPKDKTASFEKSLTSNIDSRFTTRAYEKVQREVAEKEKVLIQELNQMQDKVHKKVDKCGDKIYKYRKLRLEGESKKYKLYTYFESITEEKFRDVVDKHDFKMT